MLKIIVTGGCGYKGHVLVPKLLKRNCHVKVIDLCWFGNHLQKNKIPFGFYYPLGFHEQKAYKQEFISETDFHETNKVKEQVISLPMHTELTKKQIKFITNTIISFFE